MSRQFSATLEHLYEMLDFIEKSCDALDVNPAQIPYVRLASEEALVNIIRYSYPKKNGVIKITCSQNADPKGIKLEISDRGISFSPADLHKDEEGDREFGGLGIKIISQIMDSVEYRHDAKGNHLVMIKI